MNRTDHSEAVSVPGLRIDLTCLPVINFALQQNHVPVIRQFIIKNESAQDYTNLVIEITSEPGIATSVRCIVKRAPDRKI